MLAESVGEMDRLCKLACNCVFWCVCSGVWVYACVCVCLCMCVL